MSRFRLQPPPKLHLEESKGCLASEHVDDTGESSGSPLMALIRTALHPDVLVLNALLKPEYISKADTGLRTCAKQDDELYV
jgi:hypothetical protein